MLFDDPDPEDCPRILWDGATFFLLDDSPVGQEAAKHATHVMAVRRRASGPLELFTCTPELLAQMLREGKVLKAKGN